MGGRAVLDASPGSPASSVAGKLKQLVDTADEAAKLAGAAEAALLVSDGVEASEANGDRRRAATTDWLHALWAALYELDDALDDHNTAVVRPPPPVESAKIRSIRHWFRSSTSTTHEMEYKRLKDTVEKLSNKMHGILKQGVELDLKPIDLKIQIWNSEYLRDPIVHHDIVGHIEQQMLNLIAMLTDKHSNDNDQSCSHVVVIVGCRGTGKTTLAQKVINDHHTRNAFSMVVWVHGSKDFSELGLLSAIACAVGIRAVEGGSREKIEEMLGSMLEGKRILLVIDDVWSHQIHENYLENCLPVKHGSRILMTTWDESVAEHVKSVQIHKVEELPYPESWSLLISVACLDAERQDQTMREIGIKIVQRCNRVPLAIKVIGGLLRTKDPTYEDWEKVSEHAGWSRSRSDIPDCMKEIVGPICMAYNDLPSQLSQCFLYCLNLPEGFMISKHNISQLWISEGFIEEQQDCSPEDTAEEYYNELILRNLLQPVIGSPDMARFRVHDCVRSVLQLHTKDLWTGKPRSMTSTSTLPCFRTVVLHNNPSGDRILDEVSKTIKHLRVLDLSSGGIRHVTGSLESLVHLRFLNFSHTDITELPESIGKLKSLQFLILQCCYRFHSLPDGISKLHNLRTLDLEGTAPRLVLPVLASLVRLTTLHGFVVNSTPTTEKDTSGWPLEDLKFLNALRSLQIVKIDRIQQHQSLPRLMLSRKPHLTQLELCGSKRKAHEVAEKETRRLNDVLSSLRPPQCLESLKIVSFNGQSFPNWTLHLPNLQRLVIADCKFCERLPDLGQLPQLNLLVVTGCSELRAIERGQTVPTQAFPKLERLHLDDLRRLESWEGFEAGDLPSLVELQLERCPSLRSLPSCLSCSRLLTRMLIVCANSIEVIDGLSTLRELVVEDCKRLSRISNLPALEALTVVDCPALQDVSGLRLVKHLRVVYGELKNLPAWLLRHGSAPETLTIIGTEELLESLVPGGKGWPAISGIDRVYGYSSDGSPFFTYTKSTAELEAFRDRRKLVASSVVAHRSKNWSQNARKVMPSAVLLLAFSLVPFLLPTRYMEFIPNTVLILFFVYMGMLAFFMSVLRTL